MAHLQPESLGPCGAIPQHQNYRLCTSRRPDITSVASWAAVAAAIDRDGEAEALEVQLWPLSGEGAAGAQDTGTLKAFQEDLLAQLRPVDWAAVVFTSATTRQRLPRILEAVAEAGAQHRRRVTTATLNLVVREAVGWRSPPSLRGDPRKGRIYYSTQVGPLPPLPPLIPHLPASFMLACLNNRRGRWMAGN